MSDDHAGNAVSAYGSRLATAAPTPNIDRLGREGVRLDNCHCVNSICAPSRASILTGLHGHANGVRTLADALPDTIPLLPEMLRAGGYQTALFGKWHLESQPRGFDRWAVLAGQGDYWNPALLWDDPAHCPPDFPSRPFDRKNIRPNQRSHYQIGSPLVHDGYVTDLLTDLALDWLERGRNPDQPFFLCCHHKAPHDFFEYHPRHEHLFDGVEFPEPETLFESPAALNEISRRHGSTVSPRCARRNMVRHLQDPKYPNGPPVDFAGMDATRQTSLAYQKYMRDYLRTVRAIDENVGRLLDWLDRSGLADDTLVIYTSDQGMMLGEHDKIDKRWFFDESQRMPFLARWPREIPAGVVARDLVDNTDFAPTLLDIAGPPVPARMTGRSARAVLAGRPPAGWRQSVYYRYWMHMAHHGVPAHYAIRTQTRKLVFFYGLKLDATGCEQPECAPTEAGFELYDLEKDQLETTNVYVDPAYAGDAARLKEELLELKRQCGDEDERYPEMMALRERLW